MSMGWMQRVAVITAMAVVSGVTTTRAAKESEVIVASGKLGGQFLDSALFHIDEFWIRVASNTEFNRWLSQGIHRRVVILLTTDAARFADEKNIRILSGTLIHQTAPKPTEVTNDVIGRLPEGNQPVVHILYLKDELSASLGAVTFQTADLETAAKFRLYDDTHINIVIKIE